MNRTIRFADVAINNWAGWGGCEPRGGRPRPAHRVGLVGMSPPDPQCRPSSVVPTMVFCAACFFGRSGKNADVFVATASP